MGALQGETGLLGQHFDVLHGRQSATREDLLADEPHELEVTDGELDSVVQEELLGMRQDGVQQHPAISRQQVVGALKEHRVALNLERLEGADTDDAINGLVELLPTLQTHLDRSTGVQLGQALPGELRLLPAQRDADDVHVEFLHGPFHRATPATTDIEQGHPRLKVQLAQGEIELGVLGLLQVHIIALVIAAGVAHGRAEPQREEVVGNVVDRL